MVAPVGPQLMGEALVLPQADDRLGERRGVPWRAEQAPPAVLDELRDPPDARCDDRGPLGEGFEEDQSKSLGTRSEAR